jgi:hypothetical protein
VPEWAEIEFPEASSDEPELRHLLAALEPVGSQLEWAIRFIHGMGDVTDVWSGGMVDLERRADEAEDGVPFSWERLTVLARSVHQIIDSRFDGVGTEAIEVVIKRSTAPFGACMRATPLSSTSSP